MDEDPDILPIWRSAADNACALAACPGHRFEAPTDPDRWTCVICRGTVSDAERRAATGVDRTGLGGHSAAVDSICTTCRNFSPPRGCAAASRGASGAPALAAGQSVRTCTAYEGEDGRQTIREVPPRGERRRPLREG